MLIKNKIVLLITEDEQVLRKALHEKFDIKPFEVLEAENGGQGLSMALQHRPDVILLDMLMPKMDGLNMLKKLREDTWGKDVIVYVLTNLNDEALIAESVSLGARGYIVKNDWKIGDVLAEIKKSFPDYTFEK